MSAWNFEGPDCGGSFSEGEFKAMARLLECKHGANAAEIAAFFALEHQMLGDTGRASAWSSVASELRRGLHGGTGNT
jgi:hypothetical protein